MNNNTTSNIIYPVILNVGGKSVLIPEGRANAEHESILLDEVAERWSSLSGGYETKMHSGKLCRAETLRVENGKILFEIARHPGTHNGSTRAALHTWEVDLAAGSAAIINETHRQLKPMAKPYTKADARKSAQAVLRILTGRRKNRGELIADDTGGFTVFASSFADLGNYKRTRIGRRKQFIDALKEILPTRGWNVSGDQWTPEIHLWEKR